MRHVAVALASSRRGDLSRRLTGRFYTPPAIAQRLATMAPRRAKSVCDPFCGDGRLITAWLSSGVDLASVQRIALFDYDPDAVQLAVARVRELLPDVHIDAAAGDTFERAAESFELVLTNPPWELLKPDTRDGLADATSYRTAVRAYAARLVERFPAARGHGVNLARAGALFAMECVREGGHLGVVLPASLLADRASRDFRTELFRLLDVDMIESFPAEARAFEGVDQPFVVLHGRSGTTSSFLLRRHDASLATIDERVVRAGSAVPLTLGAAQCELVDRVRSEHPSLEDLEDLALGRELDETRLAESLTTSRRGVPFLKGRQVFPFRVEPGSLRIDPNKRAIPDSVREHRLAWRDVARPSLKRRMHVALVPDGHVTGNSLGIAYFRDGSRARIEPLVAAMNSFVFELQVRAELATAHVSLGIVRRCAVPSKLRGASEVAVARAYGLTRDEFAIVLDGFRSITAEERAAYLQKDRWR